MIIVKSSTARFILATYYMLYLHAMPFLINNALFSTKSSKNTMLRGCSFLNAQNSGKWGEKTPNCALLLDFLAFFCYTTCIPSFSRISPLELNTEILKNLAYYKIFWKVFLDKFFSRKFFIQSQYFYTN